MAEGIALAVKFILAHRSNLLKIWVRGVQYLSLRLMETNLVLPF